MEDSGRIVLYNSGGLPKTRCTQIRRHLIPELKPLILLLNETKSTSENEDDIEQLLKLNDLGYNFKTKSRKARQDGKNPGGSIAFIFRDNLDVKEIPLPS